MRIIAAELQRLRVLKEHELCVGLQYDPDDRLYYVPEAEKWPPGSAKNGRLADALARSTAYSSAKRALLLSLDAPRENPT